MPGYSQYAYVEPRITYAFWSLFYPGVRGKVPINLDKTYPRGGGERGQGTLSYLRCSVGVPGLAAKAGGWVCGGLCDMSDCTLVRGGPLGGLVVGG
jgi:hypothetical protein